MLPSGIKIPGEVLLGDVKSEESTLSRCNVTIDLSIQFGAASFQVRLLWCRLRNMPWYRSAQFGKFKVFGFARRHISRTATAPAKTVKYVLCFGWTKNGKGFRFI